MRPWGAAIRLFTLAALAGCAKPAGGEPEAVADAFCDAYFVHADQRRARSFTAFGATKMLEQEIADTKPLRDAGYTPNEASLDVAVTRGPRSNRDERVRFDYTVRFHDGTPTHADVELAKVQGEWKVVRVTVNEHSPP